MSLADRSARTGLGTAAGPASARSPEPQGVGRGVIGGKHCWVLNLPGTPGRWPGLLSEWRRTDGGQWQGRVTYAVTDDQQTVLVTAWANAEDLDRA